MPSSSKPLQFEGHYIKIVRLEKGGIALDKIIIRGRERLVGDVEVSGSKNASLAVLASVILGTG